MKYKNNQSVLIALYAQNTGRVLMLQRRDDPDFWQSITGTIETGERPEQTALREVREETGIDIVAQNLCLYDCQTSVKFEIFPQFRYKYAPHITHGTEHWFLLALEAEISPQISEHLAFKWVSPQEAMASTKSPSNAAIIQQYLTI
ncbi:dihydroneopterin triphosphate diphosphatase [Pasteurellaceae bacterium RH1A]|nr:dihydroneopterin triphosphate diphosphatase [Pasteurellaceae bacterium RH1A]